MNTNQVQILSLLAIEAGFKTTYAMVGDVIECTTHTDQDDYVLTMVNHYLMEAEALLGANKSE